MTTAQPNPFTREDTFLGVCQALGEDFGFNPLLPRLVLAGSLLWNPVVTLGAYAAMGLVVLASRLLAPNPRSTKIAAEEAAPAQLHADNETVADMLAVAA